MANSHGTKSLEVLPWSKPVLQLLASCAKLENASAQMVIRHSERMRIERQSEISLACLTETGVEAARSFGRGLPKTRKIRLHYSPVERCKDTATFIYEGAKSVNIDANLSESMEVLEGPKTTSEYWENVIRDWPYSFYYWLSGRYPSSMAESGFDYSVRAAKELENDRRIADLNDLDIYVTHDLSIMAMLFHWFGILPNQEYISYLNGFIMQKLNDKISLFVNDYNRIIGYPYWWTF